MKLRRLLCWLGLHEWRAITSGGALRVLCRRCGVERLTR